MTTSSAVWQIEKLQLENNQAALSYIVTCCAGQRRTLLSGQIEISAAEADSLPELLTKAQAAAVVGVKTIEDIEQRALRNTNTDAPEPLDP